MKKILATAMVLTASFSAHASWDGSGFYGTSDQAEKQLREDFKVTDIHNPLEQVKVYRKVPDSIISSIDACRTGNSDVLLSKVNSAALNPTTEVAVYESRSSEYASFKPVAYVLIPTYEGASVFAIDTNVSPCKAWESKPGQTKPAKPTKRVLLNSMEQFLVTEQQKINVKVNTAFGQEDRKVIFTVQPQNPHMSGWSDVAMLDSTQIQLSGEGAGQCDRYPNGKNELGRDNLDWKDVVGFRTGKCSSFKEFGYKGSDMFSKETEGGNDNDQCIQIVQAVSHQEAANLFVENKSTRKIRDFIQSGMKSAAVFSASNLGALLTKVNRCQ